MLPPWNRGARGLAPAMTLPAKTMVCIATVGLVLAGCGTDETPSGQTPSAELAGASSTTPVTETSIAPSDTSPAPVTELTEKSPTPTTTGTTLASGPPVFNRQALGDSLMLASFVLTVTVANTNSGQLSENITTTGFIKDPLGISKLVTFSSVGATDGTRSYLVGGRSYEENQFGDWYLYEAGSTTAPDYAVGLGLRSGTLGGVLSAKFVGQEDYAGVPSNHFVFDETGLASFASYSPENPSPGVEGDFYLALDGNYVLYTHSKETAPNRIYEVTEALSSVGQVAEIVLPAELQPMVQALDVGVDLGGLLPPGASLSAMIRYSSGIGVDYYTYRTSVRTIDEFLSFYRTLAPTNGWTVAHIGHIKPHLEQINCEIAVECVILNNGGEQIVVSFGGGITIEFDREHVFSPL